VYIEIVFLFQKENLMSFTALTVILIITILISMKALSDSDMTEKWLYSPYRVKHNKESYRIFSHIFIHGDVAHLIFNMMSLYFLGQNLEMWLTYRYGFVQGELHFISLYFIGALFATLIPYIRNHENPNYSSLGASGAVSAVVFGAILCFPNQELGIMFLPFRFKAYWFGLFYLVYEIYMAKKGNTGIAHDAHIGGALLGIIYILVIDPERGQNFIQVITQNITI
jgi:membrane associated rhomboid family serine protease